MVTFKYLCNGVKQSWPYLDEHFLTCKTIYIQDVLRNTPLVTSSCGRHDNIDYVWFMFVGTLIPLVCILCCLYPYS
jgi:hypothetical protein